MKLLAIYFITFYSMLWTSDEVRIIKNPVPNCEETNYKNLVKFKELKESEQSKEFLIGPFSLVVDENENIFVYDQILAKIFKYNSDLKLIKTFGSKGVGPGEIGGTSARFILASLFIKKDQLYLGDWYNKKILHYTTNGDLIEEIYFKKRLSLQMSPVIDNNGYIYLNSDPKKDSKYIIDCFDKKGEYLRGFLDRSNLFVGLYLKSEPKLQKNPGKENPDWYSMSASSNIQYSINKKDQLLVYSTTSGYFWVFTKGKLKRTGKLWPRNALSDYKICLKEVAEMGGFYPFFDKLLIDQDDPDNFLLNYQYFKNGDKRFLYKFDFSGKLDKVYYVVNPQKSFISFEYKKNRKFYGITKNKDNNLTISIYKEEKNE